MPAVALVATLALSEMGITAAAVGSAALGAAGITASTTVASVVGGSIIGAGTGALSAAVQGGKPLKGALTGAVSGGVGAGVTAGLGEALGAQGAVGALGPQIPKGAEVFGSTALGAGITKGAGAFAGGLTGGLVSGAPFGQALKGGLISGLAGGLGAGIGEAANLGPTGTALLSSGLSYGLQQALTPSTLKGISTGSYQPTVSRAADVAPKTGATTGSGLASAPSSYSPGGSVFGTSDSDKPPSNVWNVGSLRNIGEANG